MPHAAGMNAGSLTVTQHEPRGSSFDLFRLTKAKAAVDLSPNTLRSYNRLGLRFYRQGRVVFVSKAELHHFICARFSEHGGGR